MIREKYLNLEVLAEDLDDVISNIADYNEDSLSSKIFDIYKDYCELAGGHAEGGNIAETLYDIYDNINDYYPSKTDSSDDESIDIEQLIDKLIAVKNEMSAEAHDVVSANGIMPEHEMMLLSSATGHLRIQINNDFEGYASESEAEEKIWERMTEVEEKFLDPVRNKKKETQYLSDLFLSARTTKENPIPISTDDVPGRRILTADIHATDRSIATVQPEQLTTSDDISKALQWNKKSGKNWNWQHIFRGQTGSREKSKKKVIIKSQYQPSPTSLGNLHVKGIGQYGDESRDGILTVINQTTREDVNLEKCLAKLLIKFTKNGIGFTEEALRDAKLHLENTAAKRKQQIERLNRMGILCGFMEVTRRKNQGFKEENGELIKIIELPFALIGAATLKLLTDGYLRMRDVFDKNARYGVFTGKEIMHEKNLAFTKNKFSEVLKLYVESYQPSEAEFIVEEGCSIPFKEHLHSLMKDIYGGERDSSGEEYSSSDEDTTTLTGQEVRKNTM